MLVHLSGALPASTTDVLIIMPVQRYYRRVDDQVENLNSQDIANIMVCVFLPPIHFNSRAVIEYSTCSQMSDCGLVAWCMVRALTL